MPETKVEPPFISSREELEDTLEALGDVEAELQKEQRKQDRRVRKAKQRNADAIEQLEERAERMKKDITNYAKDHKDELLDGSDGKTAKLATGDIQFRAGKPTVAWEDKQEAIQALKDTGNEHLVVVRETLHKSVLKKHEQIVRQIKALQWIDAEDSVVITPL